ncbi:phospholipase-like protein [Tanacetum coccineum]
MDAVGHPDENEGPNEKEPISYVLNTSVDNGDVLMTDAPDTINLADPPSHESKITSPCGSEKKGDGLDGAKANQDGKEIKLDPLIKGTGFAVEEIFWQCLVDKDANRKGWLNDQVYIPITIDNAHWFLAEFKIMTGVVTFYDTLCGLEPGQEENHDWWPSLRKMMIEQLPQGMSKHGIFNKKDIDPKRYNITFEFSNCAPIQAGLYGDYGVWVCIMIYRLANGLSMDFPLNPMLHPD